jgi:hypothetical protein
MALRVLLGGLLLRVGGYNIEAFSLSLLFSYDTCALPIAPTFSGKLDQFCCALHCGVGLGGVFWIQCVHSFLGGWERCAKAIIAIS